MKTKLATTAISIALKLWRTDLEFSNMPYGPPAHGFRYGIAWALYHWGRDALARKGGE